MDPAMAASHAAGGGVSGDQQQAPAAPAPAPAPVPPPVADAPPVKRGPGRPRNPVPPAVVDPKPHYGGSYGDGLDGFGNELGDLGAGVAGSRPKRKRIVNESLNNRPGAEVRKTMHHCNYCHKDITNIVHIKCAVCKDFDLCVECFSVGAEVSPHKADHQYRVIDNLSFPLFTVDWTAEEELLLLEAIESHGLGNWTEVSEHVGTKSKAACRTHYFATYVNVPTAPLPDFSRIGRPLPVAPEPTAAETPAAAAAAAAAADAGEEGAKSERTFPGAVPEAKVGGNSTDITGYHAKRNEFDPEYDQEAELPLAEMEFSPADTPEEFAIKARMCMIYNERLNERARRKQFILERGLLNVKRLQAQERKRSKEEREIHARFSVFARFHSQEEQDQLVEGMIQEHRLRVRIEELKEYRRNGIHTLQEAEIYENEKRQREAERARLKALGGSGFLGAHGSKQNIRANRYLMRDGATATTVPMYGSSTREVQKLQVGAAGAGAGGASGSGKGRRAGVPLDLKGLPGTELVGVREQEVCALCRLLPVHYLAMKEAMLRRCALEGALLRQDARAMFKVDPAKVMRVYDLLLSMGWLRETPEEAGTGAGAGAGAAAAAAASTAGGGGNAAAAAAAGEGAAAASTATATVAAAAAGASGAGPTAAGTTAGAAEGGGAAAEAEKAAESVEAAAEPTPMDEDPPPPKDEGKATEA